MANDHECEWEGSYYRLLHIITAGKEMFAEDMKKNKGRRKCDKLRKGFWERIDEEIARIPGLKHKGEKL